MLLPFCLVDSSICERVCLCVCVVAVSCLLIHHTILQDIVITA